MPTMHYWSRGADERVYLNGLPGQGRSDGAWIDAAGFPTRFIRSYRALAPVTENAAQDYLSTIPAVTWEELCRLAGKGKEHTPAPMPAPAPLSNPAIRAALENTGIVYLVPAARMAGLSFRNGLTKGEIIDRLMADPPKAAAALSHAQSLSKGQTPAKPPAPVDWLDDDPQPAPAPAPMVPQQVPVDLSNYVKRDEWAQANARLADQAAAIGAHANQRIDAQAREIEALKALRPVEIHFPEKPEPVRIEGATHPQFLDLLTSLRAGLHCMLVGPAGSGKTYSAEQAAGALGRHFYMQGAITYAHELLGYIDAHSRYVRTQFRDAFEKGGLILLDEFDASSAEAALVLNAALANGACAFPDGLVRKHADFLCVIGANTDGSGATMQYAGRARLDGAFLDRFVTFRWDIDARIEESLSGGNPAWLAAVRDVREFAKKRGILDVVATPRAVAFGARLIAAGMAREKIAERTLMRGALVECWRDVLALPSIRSFLQGV